MQRDALRAIMQIGSDEAFAALQRRPHVGSARTRDMIMQSLGTLRDERAAPLFAFIVRQGPYRGALEKVYLSRDRALGHLGVSSDADAGGAAARP